MTKRYYVQELMHMRDKRVHGYAVYICARGVEAELARFAEPTYAVAEALILANLWRDNANAAAA